ncbi:MAG: hypothetical protein HETSPECPRED_002820 [Heterodermia speciosa]|uniref:Uncharacterized protein n=1 Tax=Heterodermia speciosa TaxID=116794 RepID=A0A8H3I643_9LECA|nr:MAG: hypothetical protein HETSPECPRED_002820 [Heterodermia speciosa]
MPSSPPPSSSQAAALARQNQLRDWKDTKHGFEKIPLGQPTDRGSAGQATREFEKDLDRDLDKEAKKGVEGKK